MQVEKNPGQVKRIADTEDNMGIWKITAEGYWI